MAIPPETRIVADNVVTMAPLSRLIVPAMGPLKWLIVHNGAEAGARDMGAPR